VYRASARGNVIAAASLDVARYAGTSPVSGLAHREGRVGGPGVARTYGPFSGWARATHRDLHWRVTGAQVAAMRSSRVLSDDQSGRVYRVVRAIGWDGRPWWPGRVAVRLGVGLERGIGLPAT
jgi:hypothetical protein